VELNPEHLINSIEQLHARYKPPGERVVRKQIDHLDTHARSFIAASPLLLLATVGPTGIDCSPRGDHPGFVDVIDAHTLLIPDRRGSNRIDSLRNIIANPAVGILFVVPGVNETFRVNGRACITTDPTLRGRFLVKNTIPATVLVVQVQEAFVQCARALMRADVWNPGRYVDHNKLPSIGTILAAHTHGLVDGAKYDAEAPTHLAQTLY
jgi:hypothetical protein